jgi:CubicO group peptidase (beta-lactamase class C family)
MMKRREFERVSPESVGIPSAAIESLVDMLEESEEREPHGIMVARNGKVCAEGWWAPYAAGLPHLLYSLTKTYTATAVGIAYTEGLLNLDDRLIDHYPEYSVVDNGASVGRIRIRDALCMATGKAEIRCDSAAWRRHFFEIPIRSEPGSRFEYSCEDTHILMGIVQKLAGAGLHDYLKPRLFDKIGIDADRLKWVYLPDGSEAGCGGLFATTEDSLRLMMLYLQGGLWDGERILASDYVAQATSSQIDNEEYGYGFQIWMAGHGAYFGSGILGQLSIVVPRLDMVIAFNQTCALSSSGQGGHPVHQTVEDILAVLVPSVQGGPLPENVEASTRLLRRMGRLSLGNPAARPCSTTAARISGRRYVIRSGTLTLRTEVWNHITNSKPFHPVVGLEWFSFDFSHPDACTFTFREHGKTVALQVGVDGVRRLNRYALDNTHVDLAFLDGFWVDESTFHLSARWIETPFSITVAFAFSAKGAEMTAVRLWGDFEAHPLRACPALAGHID